MKKTNKTKQAVARLSVNVPRELYREVRRLAVDLDTTITRIVIAALEAYLQKKEQERQ